MPVVRVVASAIVPFGFLSGANEGCRCVGAWGTTFWGNPENTCRIEDFFMCEAYFVCIVHLKYKFRTTRVDRAPNLFFGGSTLRIKPVLLRNTDNCVYKRTKHFGR